MLAEAMSPGGLVPEITNGRGAMAAMLIAFVKELTTGKPVGEQIKSDPIFIVIVFGLIIVGSIVPVFRGADLNQKGAGPFTPRAEIWNGRVVCFTYCLPRAASSALYLQACLTYFDKPCLLSSGSTPLMA